MIFALNIIIRMFIKNFKQFIKSRTINFGRALLNSSFGSFMIIHLLHFLNYSFNIDSLQGLLYENVEKLSLNSFFFAGFITFMFSFTLYINEWDFLILSPFFTVFGTIFINIFTSNGIYFQLYLIISPIITIGLLIEANIQTKDKRYKLLVLFIVMIYLFDYFEFIPPLSQSIVYIISIIIYTLSVNPYEKQRAYILKDILRFRSKKKHNNILQESNRKENEKLINNNIIIFDKDENYD